MNRAGVALMAAVVLFALEGCGERPQVLQANKSDVPAYQGASGPFVAPGWKAGDKTAWEEQIRKRNQAQNDYAR